MNLLNLIRCVIQKFKWGMSYQKTKLPRNSNILPRESFKKTKRSLLQDSNKLTLTNAPTTPRLVNRRYSKGLVLLVVWRNWYRNNGICAINKKWKLHTTNGLSKHKNYKMYLCEKYSSYKSFEKGYHNNYKKKLVSSNDMGVIVLRWYPIAL